MHTARGPRTGSRMPPHGPLVLAPCCPQGAAKDAKYAAEDTAKDAGHATKVRAVRLLL